jgi:hypothetical protein
MSNLNKNIQEEIDQATLDEYNRRRAIAIYDHRYSEVARQTGTEPFEEMVKYGSCIE